MINSIEAFKYTDTLPVSLFLVIYQEIIICHNPPTLIELTLFHLILQSL